MTTDLSFNTDFVHPPFNCSIRCMMQVDKAYKALISSVEELDRVASLGVKNGLKDDKSITAAYEKCVEQGNALVGALP